ncbi:histidinol-phosphate transaminase [Acidianus sp. RZ1]|uniref:aminotransferase class I/II-fold pyridoxal phosphate-dependent enzyme n=1 Tax=Acidianus sp. RZ1 TaxID=1540082 RepID=UPI001492C1D7|nr:histidinol-phosphate transaminase [Acidianus sp. RZ1]NON61945.1 histidinol-phosphate aminotransferase family protein [Acidianus sp. RZ1]
MTHGGSQWLNGKPPTVKDFSVNLNPLGTPKFLEELIQEAVISGAYKYYPDNYKELKKKIAEIYNVSEELIGVFNGASEAIFLLNDYGVIEPNFSEYKRSWSYFAEESEKDFIFKLQGKKIIVSNPNNPTGSRISLEEIVEFLSNGGELVIDESFADISSVERTLKLTDEFDKLLVISTFTKSLAIPGLRIGFTFGKKSNELESKAPPWRVNTIVYYAIANVDSKEISKFFHESKREVEQIREKMISSLNVKTYKSYAPYILAKFPTSVRKINEKLTSLGYKIRDCSDFVGLNEFYGRIAVRSDYKGLFVALDNLLEHGN